MVHARGPWNGFAQCAGHRQLRGRNIKRPSRQPNSQHTSQRRDFAGFVVVVLSLRCAFYLPDAFCPLCMRSARGAHCERDRKAMQPRPIMVKTPPRTMRQPISRGTSDRRRPRTFAWYDCPEYCCDDKWRGGWLVSELENSIFRHTAHSEGAITAHVQRVRTN